ncbi:MAG: DoxX family protein [Sphingopyxis sp.]|nr:DoxX family protein [Sphingopyxis sp.]
MVKAIESGIMFAESKVKGLSPPDMTIFCWRVLVGSFLIWGVWDNIVDTSRMAEFVAFLKAHGFPSPHVLAPLSVWAQFACGMAFMLGFATRWFGLLCAFNFVVALTMVDLSGGVRQAFPSAMLIVFGVHLAAAGAGRLAVDHWSSIGWLPLGRRYTAD